MKLVSFYADVDGKTFYSDAAKELMKECESLGVEYIVRERHFGNNWIDNVRAKPQFLLEMFDELKEPFLWLDCDCRILRPLDFVVNEDWGVYMRENGTPHDFVHYISYSEKVRNFLLEWIKAIDTQGRGSHTAFISIADKLSIGVLPGGYFEIGLAETESKQKYFNKQVSCIELS